MTALRLAGTWAATPKAAPARVVDPRTSAGPPAWRAKATPVTALAGWDVTAEELALAEPRLW